MIRRILLLSILLCAGQVFAQSFLENSQVSGSFQIDGQYYNPDKNLGITDSTIDGRKMGLAGYGKINYSLGNFSAGIRYEAYLPPLSGFEKQLEGNGIANYYASYKTEKIGITVGNFYEQFGNGLIFRTYEEWSLGYDNSMNGINVYYKPVNGVTLKAVYGSQRYFWNKYENNNRGIVRGVDGEIDLNETFTSLNDAKLRVNIGASTVSKYQKDSDPIYIMPENVAAFAGRINMGLGKFSFMTEYAYKINDPSAMNNYIYKEGQAILSSLSFSQKGLGIVLQVKRVDNMSFKSNHRITENALDINFIPPINRTHSYCLSARYPYSTQPNGEMGLQFQINYKIPKGTALGGKYGTGIALNFSQVNDIVRNPIDENTPVNQEASLGYTSPFFEVSDHIFFRDLNIEIEKKFSPKWKAIVMYMNQLYDIETIEGHAGDEAVKANIGVVDLTYKISSKKSLRMEFQGLWTEQDKGDRVSAMLEYTIAPKWFFAISDQYNYGNPIESDRNHYYTASAGFIHEATRFALTFGRQCEGVVCVGGVCRQVPASSGVSLTITTSF